MKFCRTVLVMHLVVLAMLGQTALSAPKATKEELNIVSQRLERLERALDDEAAMSANTDALITLQQKLNQMEQELQRLRGQNESLRNQVETMQKHQRESFIAIDKRLLKAEQQADNNNDVMRVPTAAAPPREESAGIQVETVSPDNTGSGSTSSESAERQAIVVSSETEDSKETIDAYRDAFLLLKNRRYDESIEAFENFLANYPRSKYSANAQYWLAEANYVTKRYERALTEFQTVIDRYPTSSKLPDARLKVGYTQYELGQHEEARVTLTRLRAQFPNSTVAGLAQERLKRLEKEGY